MANSYLEEMRRLLDSSNAELAEKMQEHKRLLDHKYASLEAQFQHAGVPERKGSAGAAYHTPGRQFVEKCDIDLLRKTGRMSFRLDAVHPANFEAKAVIDRDTLGFSTAGIVNDQRIEGFVPLPRRRLTIRDLLRAKPITAGQVSWIQETSFTNAASPQTEGASKVESEDTFQIASAKVRTIAHWIPVSRQALDDVEGLGDFIDRNLVYGLKIKEEQELLAGDGLGDHLTGLMTGGTAYSGVYAVGGDSIIDKLRHAILELEAADEQCTGFVLNPKEWHDAQLVKTSEGGAGSYIIGDPLGGTLQVPTIWNRPVVVTNTIAAGYFLAGDFSMAVIGDRMGATIDVSESHDDFFVKNKLAIRCEERLSFAVLRPGAFRYGSLA